MQKEMPLLNAMLKYKSEKVYPFHTPGHKGGRGVVPALKELMGSSALQIDVSLMSELDDIHCPAGCIMKAQNLAAELYGSDKCFFSVNGTSQAIQAMLIAACKPGDKVLVPRNAHRSVAGGLLLGNLEPIFVAPEFDVSFGINTQITVENIVKAFEEHNDIRAVLLTSPNYYGQAADVKAIADIAHKNGAVLLVDEAHGPHLGFNDKFPQSALQCGADACAQSTHKIIGGFTQCSLLHVKGERIDLQRAADVMSILSTTSPNYWLMASLDAARWQMANHGAEMLEDAFEAANKLEALLTSFDGLKILTKDCIGQHGVASFDETKVTVNFSAWGISGLEAADAFRENGIAVELADANNVLFLVTYGDAHPGFDFSLAKIEKTLKELQQNKRRASLAAELYEMPKPTTGLNLKEAFESAKTSVDLTQAEGLICGEQVSFYPPGIPVLLPGELITGEIIDYCVRMRKIGLPVSGPEDVNLEKIRVIKS